MSIIYKPHECAPARVDTMSGHAYTPGLLWQCDTCARVYRFDAGEWDLAADPWSDYALSEARRRAARGIEREMRTEARKAAPVSSPTPAEKREELARRWQGDAFTRANACQGFQTPPPATAPAPEGLPLAAFSQIVQDAAVAALPRLPREQETGLTVKRLAAAARAVAYVDKQWKHQRSPGDAFAHAATAGSAAVLAVALFRQVEREEQAE